MDRYQRGITQKIYLLSAVNQGNSWQLVVKGASGVNYNINFDMGLRSLDCSCPDFKIRKKFCKHIYFLIQRVAQYDIPANPGKKSLNFEKISQNLTNRLSKRTSTENPQSNSIISVEDDCPICYESMKGEPVTQCKITCHNYFHQSCISVWLKTSQTCPLCRSPIYQDLTAVSGDELQYLANVSLKPVIRFKLKV